MSDSILNYMIAPNLLRGILHYCDGWVFRKIVSLGSLQVFSLLSQIWRSAHRGSQGLSGTQCLVRPEFKSSYKGAQCLVWPEFRQNFFSMFNFAQSLFVPQLSSVSNWHLFVLSQNCSSLHNFWVDIADSPYFVGFIFELGQTESGWQVFDPPLSSCLQTGFPFTPMQSKLEEQGTKNRGKIEIDIFSIPGLSVQSLSVVKMVPLRHQHLL